MGRKLLASVGDLPSPLKIKTNLAVFYTFGNAALVQQMLKSVSKASRSFLRKILNTSFGTTSGPGALPLGSLFPATISSSIVIGCMVVSEVGATGIPRRHAMGTSYTSYYYSYYLRASWEQLCC